MKRTLFWLNAGPMITYEWDINGEYLHVQDLNPENHIQFQMTPMELLRLGLKCVWRSMYR